ncbi:MAG TPA: DoxX family protein [Ktedonobacteraceae bacterium]|nr:DoxX family protein [Ktedonobacteraceae bacterium]
MFIAAKQIQPKVVTHIEEPPVAKFLFADTRMAWLWIIVRLYVGYEWFMGGYEKLTGGSWVFSAHDGTGLKGFVMGALAQTGGAHPAVQGWYGAFLQSFVLPNVVPFSYVVTFGEMAVGVGLVVGCLTGIAAFFGLFMNLNFLMAGTVSVNPILGVLALFLVLAWRIAGYYGIDRYLLPILGTPWTGRMIQEAVVPNTQVPVAPQAPAVPKNPVTPEASSTQQ